MTHFDLIFLQFPEEIQGIIPGLTQCKGDHCTVLIDNSQSEEIQRKTLRHELSHIRLGHFDEDRTESDQAYLRNIQSIEAEADLYADQMSEEELSYLMTFCDRRKDLSGHFDSELSFIPA